MSDPIQPHLFIAGAPRCGTTSLFDNLARHPAISPCRVKEPGFLYPARFPMRGFRHLSLEDGLATFGRMFDRPGLRLEASANYLYAPGVAESIHALFPDARVLLVLRDPVERLLSEFQFAKMMLAIPLGMGFSAYLELQRRQDEQDPWREPHLRALTNGLYSRFVRRYLDCLGTDRVRVMWTQSMKQAPSQFLRGVCTFARIDPRFFDDFQPRSRNPSLQIRRPWLYRRWFHSNAWRVRRIAAQGGDLATKALQRLGRHAFAWATEAAAPPKIAQSDMAFLSDYYGQEAERLAALVGETPPWVNSDARRSNRRRSSLTSEIAAAVGSRQTFPDTGESVHGATPARRHG